MSKRLSKVTQSQTIDQRKDLQNSSQEYEIRIDKAPLRDSQFPGDTLSMSGMEAPIHEYSSTLRSRQPERDLDSLKIKKSVAMSLPSERAVALVDLKFPDGSKKKTHHDSFMQ